MRTDAELVRAARTDPAAFRELYERYAERVHGYHLRRTRQPDAAVDLTAETFAQAWLSRRRFRDCAGGCAGPWLFGIARNVLAQSVRRERVERSASERLGMLEPPDRERTAAAPDESWLEGLDEAWDHLPPGQRDALELRVLQELDYDQVAHRLDTSPAAARVRVARGLGFLRARVAPIDKEAV